MPDSDSAAQLRQHIDRNLLRVYEDALNAEVPDRFKVLLAALKEKEKAGGQQHD
jgi:hypothetical protein